MSDRNLYSSTRSHKNIGDFRPLCGAFQWICRRKIHSSARQVQQYLAEVGIRTMNWPACSPNSTQQSIMQNNLIFFFARNLVHTTNYGAQHSNDTSSNSNRKYPVRTIILLECRAGSNGIIFRKIFSNPSSDICGTHQNR